jgi:cytochrome c-type biogenesis protein
MTFDLPTVFAAGLLTFASPCVLPLVPIYLGLLAGTSVAEVRRGARIPRLVATSLAFSAGLAAVFVALGLAATSAGRFLAAHREALLRVGGASIALLGAHQLGLLRLPFVHRERRPLLEHLGKGGSLAGAFAFGAAFALGWTPCVGPVLGAVLTYAASASASPARSALLLGTYAAGIAAPLVAVAAAAPQALAFLDRVKPHLRTIERVTGALLVAAGSLLAMDRLSALTDPVERAAASRAAAAAAAPGSAADATGASCRATATGSACATPALPSEDLAAEALAGALARADGPAVVELVSEHCPACARMQPVVDEARKRCAGKHLRIDQQEVESAPGAALARRHAVRGVPTFLLLDARGAEVGRLVGEMPLAVLERAMRDLTGGRCALAAGG